MKEREVGERGHREGGREKMMLQTAWHCTFSNFAGSLDMHMEIFVCTHATQVNFPYTVPIRRILSVKVRVI